jgi:hypothetical protein
MFINEYGDKNNPLVLLLAPMMVSEEISMRSAMLAAIMIFES